MHGEGRLHALIHDIRRVAMSGMNDAPDAQLLSRFVSAQDEEALTDLVHRYGPMVLGVCHQILRNPHDAEDAFQATFLVLIRRAGSIRRPTLLAGWLHGVAYRVATRLRGRIARQRAFEKLDMLLAETIPQPESPPTPDEWCQLHKQLNLLPDKFRLPLVLCYFQGLSREQAAQQLGWTEGAFKGMLERGRALLRRRLAGDSSRRTALLPEAIRGTGPAPVPAHVVSVTVAAAVRFGKSTTQAVEGVPTTALSLAEEVLQPMLSAKMVLAAASVLLGVMISGALLYSQHRPPAGAGVLRAASLPVFAPDEKTPAPVEEPVAKELRPFQGAWKLELCDSLNQQLHAPQEEVWKWRWSVKGSEIIWRRQGQEWKLGFKVDPDKSPKEIDLTYLSGPFKGETCLGMYEWGGVDGKTLMISIQDPGAKVARPNAIRMTGTSQNSLIFLRHTESIDPTKELASLQGTWTFAIVQTDAWPKPMGKGPDKLGRGSERRWVVKGNEIVWTSTSGEEIKVSFTIDPYKVPKHIDFTFRSGPHKGEQCAGVYEWVEPNRKFLWLCMADPGAKAARPKNISYSTHEGRSMIGLSPYTEPASKK